MTDFLLDVQREDVLIDLGKKKRTRNMASGHQDRSMDTAGSYIETGGNRQRQTGGVASLPQV